MAEVISLMEVRTQDAIDQFYRRNGPCCAGCDWWRWYNSVVGDCTRTAPVSGLERIGLLGFDWISIIPQAGHIMTPREHVCGEFRDSGKEKNDA